MKIRIEHTSWVIEVEPGRDLEVLISHENGRQDKAIRCSAGELYLLGQAIKTALSKSDAR